MLISKIDSSRLTREQITKLVFGDLENVGRRAHGSFVFGNIAEKRADLLTRLQ